MSDIPRSASQRYEQLIEEILQHDRLYYVEDAPRISDREYDRLFDELKNLEERYPKMARLDSPTKRVGAPPKEGFSRVRHFERMYSLSNTYNEDELEEFLLRVRNANGGSDPAYVVEPKLDGASIELYYRAGALATALTRGDGIEGEDVTSNLRTVRSLPLGIKEKGEVIVRGEVFINKSSLKAVNEERESAGEPLFANPRNAASGSLRLLDPATTARRPLRVFLYELNRAPKMPSTHAECLEWIAAQGLPTHGLEKPCKSSAEVLEAVRGFGALRNELPFEIDGAVIKVDHLKLRHKLGFTARFPRFASAFKFEPEQAKTRLLEIAVQVGRIGTLTPVAKLEPVSLAGTTVSRASLHNEDEIRSKDIRVGDTVIIEKAGEIIPHVVGVIAAPEKKRPAPFSMPKTCPVCGAPAERRGDEARWRCTNRLSCPGQLKAAIIHFASRNAMNIEHLGPSLAEQLVDKKMVATPADLYSLTRETVAELERMGDKSAQNLIDAVEASKSRSLDKLINGLGIPLVGEVAAVDLAKRWGSLSGFASRDAEEEMGELASIHGIGPKIAESVASSLKDDRFMAVVGKLLETGIDPVASSDEGVSSSKLKGVSFCVTGTLSRPRPQIHEMIKKAGGDVHTAVKKGTTYLVAGEKVGAKKIEKAKANQTIVIDEAQLTKLIEEGGA